MNRRETLRIMGLSSASLLLQGRTILKATPGNEIKATDFGNDFTWGTATASYQIEGGWNLDGKGTSIWDTFTEKPGNIADGADGKTACDFYHRYQKDIQILKNLGFDSFRFSLSWPRIIPSGTGKINHKGLDFYKKVIDSCLENGIEPWITLYHWDLPQALEDKGGWTNRDIIHWFNEFSHVASRELGDRVKKWIILNEPLSFTAFGYMTGYHAPGRKGFRNFLPAVHHAAMCQAGSARVIRENVQNAYIGTTFSCSPVQAVSEAGHHQKAARRIDALLNRLFIEPALGMGYPADDLPVLAKLEKYMLPGDEDMLKFDFDFIGLQHYFRVIAKFSVIPPVLWANQVKPEKRGVPVTSMGWEIYPEAIYQVIRQFSRYPLKDIYITENGAAFQDKLENGEVKDPGRTAYFNQYLQQVLRAKNEGINLKGYFAWTFTDNFEWAEGYRQRFGLVYNDFNTQQRIVKDSGKWFALFLKK